MGRLGAARLARGVLRHRDDRCELPREPGPQPSKIHTFFKAPESFRASKIHTKSYFSVAFFLASLRAFTHPADSIGVLITDTAGQRARLPRGLPSGVPDPLDGHRRGLPEGAAAVDPRQGRGDHGQGFTLGPCR